MGSVLAMDSPIHRFSTNMKDLENFRLLTITNSPFRQLETAAERRRLRRERKMMEDKSSIVSLRIDATAGSLSVKMGSERSLDTQAAIRNVRAFCLLIVGIGYNGDLNG